MRIQGGRSNDPFVQKDKHCMSNSKQISSKTNLRLKNIIVTAIGVLDSF